MPLPGGRGGGASGPTRKRHNNIGGDRWAGRLPADGQRGTGGRERGEGTKRVVAMVWCRMRSVRQAHIPLCLGLSQPALVAGCCRDTVVILAPPIQPSSPPAQPALPSRSANCTAWTDWWRAPRSPVILTTRPGGPGSGRDCSSGCLASACRSGSCCLLKRGKCTLCHLRSIHRGGRGGVAAGRGGLLTAFSPQGRRERRGLGMNLPHPAPNRVHGVGRGTLHHRSGSSLQPLRPCGECGPRLPRPSAHSASSAAKPRFHVKQGPRSRRWGGATRLLLVVARCVRCASAVNPSAAFRVPRGQGVPRETGTYRRLRTSITSACRSAGETPGIRPAWPRVAGRRAASFSRASHESERSAG